MLNEHRPAIPTLENIADAPACTRGLSGSALAALTARCAVAQAAVGAELIRRAADIHTEEPDGEPAKHLTAKQMAECLQVPETWVRTEARQGKIPFVAVGRYVRFKAADVLAAIAARKT